MPNLICENTLTHFEEGLKEVRFFFVFSIQEKEKRSKIPFFWKGEIIYKKKKDLNPV